MVRRVELVRRLLLHRLDPAPLLHLGGSLLCHRATARVPAHHDHQDRFVHVVWRLAPTDAHLVPAHLPWMVSQIHFLSLFDEINKVELYLNFFHLYISTIYIYYAECELKNYELLHPTSRIMQLEFKSYNDNFKLKSKITTFFSPYPF